MSSNLDEIPCPWCGHTHTEHNSLGEPGAVPSDLDISLCMSCGQFSLFCVHPEGLIHLKQPPGGLGYAHVLSVLQGAE